MKVQLINTPLNKEHQVQKVDFRDLMTKMNQVSSILQTYTDDDYESILDHLDNAMGELGTKIINLGVKS